MSWGVITAFFILSAGMTLFGLEVVRSIVDRRRREKYGMGGTQDIAIYGILVGYFFIFAAVVAGAMWLWNAL